MTHAETAWYRWEDGDLVLSLHVQPRAKQDQVAGPEGDALKVRITAPPVEGKANQHLCRMFADLCGVSRSSVELVAGAQGRRKRIRVHAPKRLPAGIQPPDTNLS